MRLAKTVEVVFSVAISGSVMLVLSGSALAAEGGASTTSQNTSSTNSQEVISSNSTETVSTNSVVNLAVGTESGGSSSGSAQGAAETRDAKTTSPAPAGGSAAQAAPSVKKGEAPADGALNVSAAAVDQTALPAGVVMPAAAKPAPGAASVITAEEPTAKAVVFQSNFLPLQPKITTARAVAVEDLAATLPTAPSTTTSKVPTEPSQSSGLLSRLSAGLAGSVVPPVFVSPVLVVLGMVLEVVALLLISLLALGRGARNFGALLRRGGFAHAARSDVGEWAPFSLFATPLVLSYVPADAPRHSSFLVVAETKNARLMYPTLLERRK